MNKQLHPAVQVAAATEGFRRAGRIFGRDPQTIALGALSPQEHASITADRSLVVVATSVVLDAEQVEALPYRTEKHVTSAKVGAVTTVVSVDTAAAAVELANTKAYLESLESDLKATEAELIRRRDELDGIATEQSARETALNARAAQLDQAATELADKVDAFEKAQAASNKAGTTKR